LLIALAALGSAMAACDTRVGADPAQRFLLERLETDIAAAEQAKSEHRSPSFPCRAILATIDSLKNVSSGARERMAAGHAVCRAGALAFAQAQVQRLESARKAREDLVEECFDLEHSLEILTALDKNDAAIGPLLAKRRALCP
jgi:hypothetical protein